MTPKKYRPSTTRRLHRSLGAGAALFVIFMVLSGLAINHSNRLGLDRHHVSQPFLLDWYGLEGPGQIQSYAVGEDWLSFAGSQVYLNGENVATIINGAGAVSSAGILVVAGGGELLLLEPDGGLIERIPWGPPATGEIESIGLFADGSVAVKSTQQIWRLDSEFLSWQLSEGTRSYPRWSSPEPTPATIQLAITRQFRSDGLILERLLLDLHSGRIFGRIGVLVYDLMALSVGFLAISGLVLWLRSRRNGKGNGKNK